MAKAAAIEQGLTLVIASPTPLPKSSMSRCCSRATILFIPMSSLPSSPLSQHPRRSRAYFFSLPERVVRALAAAVGGLAYQASEVLLPSSLRGTKLYQATVARMLRITVEMVGGVHGAMPADTVPVREMALRKVAGN